jgi:hypothetical protein
MIKRRPATPPSAAWVPLRGPSGRLYGYYDPRGQVIEFKKGGQVSERIELTKLK